MLFLNGRLDYLRPLTGWNSPATWRMERQSRTVQYTDQLLSWSQSQPGTQGTVSGCSPPPPPTPKLKKKKKKKITKTLCVWSQWTFFSITVFYHRVRSWKLNQKYVPLECEWKSVLYCLCWKCALLLIFMAIGPIAMSEGARKRPQKTHWIRCVILRPPISDIYFMTAKKPSITTVTAVKIFFILLLQVLKH